MGDTHNELHRRFTDFATGEAEFSRVLDMGCGFGKSTLPFITRFPNAHVEGIDLSAPCLKVAAQTARDSEYRNVHYRQMDAQDTKYDDESFDLVTSTMLLHELPTEAVNRVLDEAFRLLRPGGHMVHLDFHIIPDEFRRFLHYGHAVRNNEPFMQDLVEMDLNAVLSAKGFENITFRQFAESENIDPVDNDVWRFPWTVILRECLAADTLDPVCAIKRLIWILRGFKGSRTGVFQYHPPYDVWCTADEDYLLIQAEAGGI